MRKIFCDKCSTELKEPHYLITTKIQHGGMESEIVKEYCDKCWKAIAEVM